VTLRAIAFDLWETLITERPGAPEQWKRLRLERMARLLSLPPEALEHAYRHSWDRCQELYWSGDKDVPCRVQVEHFLEPLGVHPDEETMAELERAYAGVALDFPPGPVAGAEELLPELKAHGYKLGLISNTGRTPGSVLRTILEQLNLARHFDAMVFSNEHGACKPRRSIFEALRGQLGVGYDEMLFVGDNLYVDVHGAKSCGMLAVHFVPPRRGSAIAPPVDHGLEIVPDATITHLGQLSEICDRAHAEAAAAEGRSR
jgi:putative hydrolase of the HAD superfamily